MYSWISNLLNSVLCGRNTTVHTDQPLYDDVAIRTILDKNFDLQVDTKQMLDNGLFITFICIFLTFFLGSAYVFLKEEKKSLKEISNKVKRTSEALMCILVSIWTLKQFKTETRKMEEEKIKILKMNTCFNLSIEGKDFKVEKKCEDTQKKDVIYCQEDEFPQEIEIPPTEDVETIVDAKADSDDVGTIDITDFVESLCATFEDRRNLDSVSLGKVINPNLELTGKLKIDLKNGNFSKGFIHGKRENLDNVRIKSKTHTCLGAKSWTSYPKLIEKEDKKISSKLGMFERHKKILSDLKSKK